MKPFNYSKSYNTGDKVTYQGSVYQTVRGVPAGTSVISSTANVRSNKPDDDGGVLLGAAIDSLFESIPDASDIFEGAGGLFGGGGAGGLD